MDRDKGKEEALKPLEGTKKTENTSGGQDAEATAGNKKETEAKEDTDVEFEEKLEGTETEYSDEDTVLSTSDEFDVLCSTVLLSPKESSTNNPPKGIKKKNVVEQAAADENNQDEELILSPKESSTNNPKGMNQKRVREEEEEEDKKKKLKAADSLSDTGTSKFPTSPPIDKFMDSDKDDQSMRSPPGDQGSSHRKNL